MRIISKCLAALGGLAAVLGFGVGQVHALPVPDNSIRISEIQEQSPLYLEHAIQKMVDQNQQLAWHTSHSSHSSHYSHSSHQSHYSHYSGR